MYEVKQYDDIMKGGVMKSRWHPDIPKDSGNDEREFQNEKGKSQKS